MRFRVTNSFNDFLLQVRLILSGEPGIYGVVLKTAIEKLFLVVRI